MIARSDSTSLSTWRIFKRVEFNIPPPLLKDISRSRCLPVIGAGFSMNATRRGGGSMPDWNALAQNFADEAKLDSTKLSPLELAQQYEQKFGRVQLIEAIRSALRVHDADPGPTHLAFAKLLFETVYTTNFDFLLEDAYTITRKPFRSLVGEQQLPFHAGRDATNIVKMHGDLRHEEHIVISKHDFDDYMTRYPVIATHLAAMLITKTPLFIGYSLSDPDFRHVREIVRSRLGNYERMAYMIQFDWNDERIAEALTDRVHVIALTTGDGRSRSDVLTAFLEQLALQADTDAAVVLRTARPDLFETVPTAAIVGAASAQPLSAVVESASTLCFVSIPAVGADPRMYAEVIAPAVRAVGLAAMRVDELPPSEGATEQVRAAIQQSRVCIADVSDSHPNVIYELELARRELNKPVVIIAREGSRLPSEVLETDVIRYTAESFDDARERLTSALRQVLIQDKLPEADRLLQQKLDHAAVAAASIVLEAKLRELARQHDLEHGHGIGLGRLTTLLAKHEILRAIDVKRLTKMIDVRNRAVHIGHLRPGEGEEFVRTLKSLLPILQKLAAPTRTSKPRRSS